MFSQSINEDKANEEKIILWSLKKPTQNLFHFYTEASGRLESSSKKVWFYSKGWMSGSWSQNSKPVLLTADKLLSISIFTTCKPKSW